jgi:hypothetical protein
LARQTQLADPSQASLVLHFVVDAWSVQAAADVLRLKTALRGLHGAQGG